MVKVYMTQQQHKVYKAYKRLQHPSLVAKELNLSISTIYMHLNSIGRLFKYDWKRKWASRGLIEVDEASDGVYG